jgi:uncharacterized protein
MTIDFRLRPPFGSFLDTFMFAPRPTDPDPVTIGGLSMDLVDGASFTQRSMPAFFDEMDSAGIDLGVVVGRTGPQPWQQVANDDVLELVQRWPDKFVGVGTVAPAHADPIGEIDRLAAAGIVGLAFDNGYWDLADDDESLLPIYDRAAEHGLMLMLTDSVWIGADLDIPNPVHLQRVALRYPQTPIIAAHGNWPWVTQLCAVAFQCPNVYLLPDCYLNMPNMPGVQDYVRSANYFLGHRLLFGSAYPVRPLGEAVQRFSELDFASDTIRQQCLSGSAERLLGRAGSSVGAAAAVHDQLGARDE